MLASPSPLCRYLPIQCTFLQQVGICRVDRLSRAPSALASTHCIGVALMALYHAPVHITAHINFCLGFLFLGPDGLSTGHWSVLPRAHL